MAKRLRALVVSPEAPYPLVGGGQLRMASILEYLRWRYEVEVITFAEPGAEPIPFPDDIRVHVIELPFHSKSPAARVARNLGRAVRGAPPLVDRFSGFEERMRGIVAGRRFDVGLIEHFWCAPYWSVLRPVCDRLIVDLVDVDSVLLARQARGAAAPVFHRFASECRRMERALLPKFDDILVTSEADAAHVGLKAHVYPNTIPEAEQPAVAKQNCIAFSGNMEYEPNTTGVRWFHREVWPQLRERTRWRLIGRNEHAIQGIVGGDDRVDVTGPVEDAVEELAKARVAVVPLRAGSGTRVKIVEAWAAGLPVVSTTIGAEGLPQAPLLIADTPAEFARAVIGLLDNSGEAERLGGLGRRLYEERFTWRAAWGTLVRLGL